MIARIPHRGPMGPLVGQLLLDRIEQGPVHDGRLRARQDLVFVFDLADIEAVAQQIEQQAAAEENAAASRTRREQPGFGAWILTIRSGIGWFAIRKGLWPHSGKEPVTGLLHIQCSNQPLINSGSAVSNSARN